MNEACCSSSPNSSDKICPVNKKRGKRVPIITLKSLLKPSALETLDPETDYFFCADPDCSVVYFNQEGQYFRTNQVKVAVFGKSEQDNVPVCYCFGWTSDRLRQEIAQTGKSSAEKSIRQQIAARRCGCEVNNPQGACCLVNVRAVVQQLVTPKDNLC